MSNLSLRAFLVCGLMAAAAPLANADTPSAPGPVVLKAAHIFDAVSGKLAGHGVVVVQNGKITGIGAQAQIPADARVIDLGNATLMPGMIDAHVHLNYEFEDNWYEGFYQRLMRVPAEQALYAAHYAKETLDAGFTSVRDVGSVDYIGAALRNAIDAGVIEGPRMIVSNYAIGSTGGHADSDPLPGMWLRPSVRSAACAMVRTSAAPPCVTR